MKDDKKQSGAVRALIDSAKADGALSPEGHQALTVVDLGAQIQAGLGVAVDDVEASEVVLVTILVDDSGSIAAAGNTDAVRSGHNLVVQSLLGARRRDEVLFHTRYLNGPVLNPFRRVDQAVLLDGTNYDPVLGTPLYDQAVVVLGTVLAKAQQFAQSGVAVRTVTLFITDGGDCDSKRHGAREVAAIVRDMRRSEQHVVAGLGIHDGSTDFAQVFQQMGIDPRWILTAASSAKEIRAAFALFSQSVMRASQGAGAFNKASLGGFVA